MTRDDITLELGAPDYYGSFPGEKMVEIIFRKSSTALIKAIQNDEHQSIFDIFFAEPDHNIVSARIIDGDISFTLTDLEDGTSQLKLYIVPSKDGDDILDGTTDPEDLSLQDMMNVVAAVKSFMRLLE